MIIVISEFELKKSNEKQNDSDLVSPSSNSTEVQTPGTGRHLKSI